MNGIGDFKCDVNQRILEEPPQENSLEHQNGIDDVTHGAARCAAEELCKLAVKRVDPDILASWFCTASEEVTEHKITVYGVLLLPNKDRADSLHKGWVGGGYGKRGVEGGTGVWVGAEVKARAWLELGWAGRVRSV